MENKIEKFGINIFYLSSFCLGSFFLFEYFSELYSILFSKSTLQGNNFNFIFLIFWNLTTMNYFVNKEINKKYIDYLIYITGWLSIILHLFYLLTYNQVVDYEKESIQRIIYFNIPWVYFFLSWINLRYIKSKFN
jgi:hypothetical protein